MFDVSIALLLILPPSPSPFFSIPPLPQSYGLNADGSETPQLVTAINEFVKSLAGYSIICYALAIKDRYSTVHYGTLRTLLYSTLFAATTSCFSVDRFIQYQVYFVNRSN